MKISFAFVKSASFQRGFFNRYLLVTTVVLLIFSVCSHMFRPMIAEKIALWTASTRDAGSTAAVRTTTHQNVPNTAPLTVAHSEKFQTAEQQAQTCRTQADLERLPDYAKYFYSRPRLRVLLNEDDIFLNIGSEAAAVRDDYIYLLMAPCMTRLEWSGTKQKSTIEKFLARFEVRKQAQFSQIVNKASPIASENAQAKQLLNAVVPDLAPWDEYSNKVGLTPAVYNDYVNNKIPDYLAQLGYTKEQIAEGVAHFKKQVLSPQSSTFKNVQLAYGVSLDIPSHWAVLAQDSRKTIAAAGEAILENAGAAASVTKKTNLLAVSAVPSPTGATIRVNLVTPAEYTQSDLSKISLDDLAQVKAGLLTQFKQLEASGGPKILEMRVPTLGRIDNKLSMVMQYTREGVNGSPPWQVTQYKVPLADKLIEITLSHRIEDEIMWKPILEKVTNSVRLQ